MTFTRVLEQVAVSDEEASERWCTALFGAPADARPVAGLLERHLSGSAGVQVWRDGGVEPGGRARLLRLTDPDGNLVVVTGP